MNDHQLHTKLSTWQPEVPTETGFHRDVWRRIDALESRPSAAVSAFERFINFITQPALGLPLAVFTLTLSAWLAFHNGTETRDQTWSHLEVSYNQSIDPLTLSPE